MLPKRANTTFVCPLLHKAIHKHQDTLPKDISYCFGDFCMTLQGVFGGLKGKAEGYLDLSQAQLSVSQQNNFFLLYFTANGGWDHPIRRGIAGPIFSCFATYKSKKSLSQSFVGNLKCLASHIF